MRPPCFATTEQHPDTESERRDGVPATIPLDNGEAFAIPAQPAFVPDRLGVRSVAIDVDRETDCYRARLILCPADGTRWGPVDESEMVSPDLLAELMASPASEAKFAALMAVQQVKEGLATVARYIRETRAAS